MKRNEVIKTLKNLKSYHETCKKLTGTHELEIDALTEAIRCVELLPELVSYVNDSGDLFICDCDTCEDLQTRRKSLLKKAKEDLHADTQTP